MKYSYEFKDYIVKHIVNQKFSTSLTSREFDIPLKTLEKWITAYNKNPNCFTNEFFTKKKEISLILKKYNTVLRDNDILKKMISSLSKKTK